MTDRQSTHGPDCWGWGPKHYECAVERVIRDEALMKLALEALESAVAEIERLREELSKMRAEVERLSSYYKNGIDCFATPCEEHSGERAPPFDEFFEKYGGLCLICVVDNNEALQAENERLRAAFEELLDALRQIAEWPDGGNRYGQENVKRFAKAASRLRAVPSGLRGGDG